MLKGKGGREVFGERVYRETDGSCIPEISFGKEMGKKRKSIKVCLCFAAMFCICGLLIGNFTLPVRAAVPETYTTFFDTDGGECEVESITVEKGESLILPPATLEGFHFQVWPVGSSFTPKEDGPLFAVWKIIVTYDAGRGECAETEKMAGTKEEGILPDASCEGYDCTGWYKDESLQEYVGGAGEGYLPERNVTLYAGWEKQEKPQFTITFNAGEGECGETTVLVEEGTAVSLPEASREGYDFTGWYKDAELTEYVGAAGEDYLPDGDSGLYAGWKVIESGDNRALFRCGGCSRYHRADADWRGK